MLAQRIAGMEMRVGGSPADLARRGTPQTPNDRREHECLPYGHAPNVSWNFTQNGKPRAISVSGRLCANRSEEHTSELQSLMRTSYAVFCLKKKKKEHVTNTVNNKQL